MGTHTPAPRRALRDPDTIGSARLVTTLVWCLLAAAFAGSANALVAAATATGLPEWLAWIGPLAIDGYIVVLLRVRAVMRHRGHRQRGIACDLMVTATTIASVALNVLHARSLGIEGFMGMAGQIMAAAFPVLVVIASRAVDWMTVATPTELAAQTAEAERQETAALRAESRKAIEKAREAERVRAGIEVEVAKVRAEAAERLAEITARHPELAPADTATTATVNTSAPATAALREAPTRNASTVRIAETGLADRAAALRQQGLSQQKIADELDISRPKVQRLLAAADRAQVA